MPEITFKELIDAVREHCQEGWVKQLKPNQKPNEYPCRVGISRIFLKMVLKDKKTKEEIIRYINFEIPMGC